jgi:hypothetical protein
MLIQANNPVSISSENNELILKSLTDLQASHKNVLKELDHFRQINNEKRLLILKLETELKKMKETLGDSVATQEAESLIKKLQLQLRDSEMCTATLEAESEDLHSRLKAFNQTYENYPGSYSHENEKTTKNEDNNELLKNPQTKTHLMRCSSELITCKELEDITRTLISCLIKTDNNATIYMTGNGKDCLMATSGGTSSEIRDLLRSITPANDWLDTKQGKILSLEHCRILLSNGNEDPDNETLEDIAMIVATANAATMQLELTLKTNQQRAILEKLISEAKKSISGIEIQNKYMADEGGKAMRNHYEQINNFAETLDLTETQKKCILEIIDELKGRMQILFGTRTSMDTSFANLINLLDKKSL